MTHVATHCGRVKCQAKIDPSSGLGQPIGLNRGFEHQNLEVNWRRNFVYETYAQFDSEDIWYGTFRAIWRCCQYIGGVLCWPVTSSMMRGFLRREILVGPITCNCYNNLVFKKALEVEALIAK